VRLVGYYIEIGHDARSHVTMHGHMSRCTVTCHDARSHVTMHGHMNVKIVFCVGFILIIQGVRGQTVPCCLECTVCLELLSGAVDRSF
jgi:hypothetical protein